MPDLENSEDNKNYLLIILVLINTVFVSFLLIQQMNLSHLQDSTLEEDLSNQIDYHYTPHSDLKPRPDHTIQDLVFKEMDVNFTTRSGPRRFLKFSFILAVDTPLGKTLEEIENKKPTIRDGIYALINQVTARSVLTSQGKEALKIKLIKQINLSLEQDKAVRIYFTKFIVK